MHVGSLTPREFIDEETHLLEQAAVRGPCDRARAPVRRASARRGNAPRPLSRSARCNPSPTRRSPTWSSTRCAEVLDRLRTALSADTAAILLLDTETDEPWPARPAASRRRSSAARDPRRQGLRRADRRRARCRRGPGRRARRRSTTRSSARRASSRCRRPADRGGEVRGVVHVGALTPRSRAATGAGCCWPATESAMALDHSRLVRERDVALSPAAEPCPIAFPRYRA